MGRAYCAKLASSEIIAGKLCLNRTCHWLAGPAFHFSCWQRSISLKGNEEALLKISAQQSGLAALYCVRACQGPLHSFTLPFQSRDMNFASIFQLLVSKV